MVKIIANVIWININDILKSHHYQMIIKYLFHLIGIFKKWWEKLSHRVFKKKDLTISNSESTDSKSSWLSPKVEKEHSQKRILRSSSFSHDIPKIPEKNDITFNNNHSLR